MPLRFVAPFPPVDSDRRPASANFTVLPGYPYLLSLKDSAPTSWPDYSPPVAAEIAAEENDKNDEGVIGIKRNSKVRGIKMGKAVKK